MRSVVLACVAATLFVLADDAASAQTRPAAERARCGGCHIQSRLAEQSPMAATLGRAADSRPLLTHADLKFSADGYDYRIQVQDGKPWYTVTGSGKSIRVQLDWFFGSARTGQTYGFRLDGRIYESRISYYPAIDGLDLTIGAVGSKPKDLMDAAGREMPPDTVRECFGCHGSAERGERVTSADSIVPGVTCEHCHGSAEKHLSVASLGRSPRGTIANWKDATADRVSDLCGRCHRTWTDVVSMGVRGLPSVRFQPYRLMNSRCYDPQGTRLRCTSCHDPHKPQEMSPTRVDATCKSCHGATAATRCPKATANCASCHMPKYEIPGSHGLFTDHMIRLVKAGDKLPD